MQTKSIRKVISAKISEWIESINDDDLKRLLYRDVIVTGGCITSLFNNEPVNDYDVYIATYETLLKTVRYYTSNSARILKGSDKSKYIADIEADYGDIEDVSNAYAISVRNLKADQIKLFFDGEAGMKFEITENTPKYSVAFLSPNAISLTNDIQIVIRFWGTPDVIHESYDFIHATNYYTCKDGLVTNKDALESILTKQLRYKGSLYPVTSIIRVKKFVKRGWNITAGEILKMVFQASLLNLSDPDVLEEQLIGVDIAYFARLIEILNTFTKEQGKGTNMIEYSYLATIIDRVFNDDDNDE